VKWQRGTENDDVVDQRPEPTSSPSYDNHGSGYESSSPSVEHREYRSSSRRSSGSGFPAIRLGSKFGVAGTVIAIGVWAASRFYGGDGKTSKTTKTSTPTPTSTQKAGAPQPPTPQPDAAPAVDPDKEVVEFVKFALKDIQDTFDAKYKTQRKKEKYRRAKLVLFKDAVSTGCGHESSMTGPFYCPKDEHAYIDLSWFHDLATRREAPGNFAQAYVLGHEIGHHLQTISGMKVKTSMLTNGKDWNNALQVRQELQADCFAGVWGHSANERNLLEIGDLEKALAAASAVGSDKTRPHASPETFTHGTSAQRMKWFKIGFESGKLDACDTFKLDKL
jgi:uncharacterized protein